jgi:hypothetical protein
VRKLALLFRDRRDAVFVKWQEAMREVVSDDYREVLESPIGLRMVGAIIEEAVNLSQAEPYEITGIWKRVEQVTFEEASRRARLDFTLDDILAGVQSLRLALWRVVIDAQVTGDLPSAGETMDEMSQVDAYLDRLVRAEVRGYLAGLEPDEDE